MLEQVIIQNFKSIREVRVDLAPVTVFIGRSGVGKSNFLRALRFLRNFLMFGDRAVQFEGGWGRIWPFGAAQPVVLSTKFRLPGFDDPFTYELQWKPTGQSAAGLVFEKLMAGGEVLLAWQDNKWSAWPGAGTEPRIAGNQVYLNQLPTVTEAVLSFTAWTSGVGWHDFPATVLTGAPQPNGLFGGGEANAKGLGDTAANYLSVIRDLTEDLRDQLSRRQILARLRQVNDTVRSVELDSVQNPRQVIVGHETGGVKWALDLSQESDGFRRYYAHLLSLYQKPPKQILMFEEPENGVYPGALRNLAEEFAEAPQAGRGQVLLTTQSPELLDSFQADQIRVVDFDPATSQTRIGPLDADQAVAVREHLLEPGELLTVDAARIGSNKVRVGVTPE